MGLALGPRQRRNGREVLAAVSVRAERQGWTPKQARRVARLAINCCLTESNLHNYGNVGISDSFELADPVPAALRIVLGQKYMGHDHASVGLFQQQVPMWGTVAECMDPKQSCHKFMGAAAERGVDLDFSVAPRRAIQAVQVSFDPNGWNYARNRLRAVLFVRHYWKTKGMRPR